MSASLSATPDTPSPDNSLEPELQLQAEAEAAEIESDEESDDDSEAEDDVDSAVAIAVAEALRESEPEPEPGSQGPPDRLQDALVSSAIPPGPAEKPTGRINQDATEPRAAGTSYHPDGRVKNPTPKRLQGGKMNENSGNFAVLHMDVNRHQLSERDEVAKRTSAGIEAAARLASKGGYQAVKRSKLVWNPDKSSPSASQGTPQHPQQQPQPYATRPGPQYSSPYHGPAAHQMPPQPSQPPPPPAWNFPGPSADATKMEQARLLTLLRSLHPVLVVDQLCKALAFFGGIPGAPPPADGFFPVSAATNGPGPLFIGWVAEIFPPVDGPPVQGQMMPPPPPPGHPAAGPIGSGTSVNGLSTPIPKKKRGRPKGSKSKVPRKDKGKPRTGLHASEDAPASDDEGPVIINLEPGVVLEPSAVQLGPDDTQLGPKSSQPGPDSSVTSTPRSKRGRPKGSKNRPRASIDGIQESPNGTSANSAVDNSHAGVRSSASSSVTSHGASTSPEQSRVVPSTPQRASSGAAQSNALLVPSATGLHLPTPLSKTLAQPSSQIGPGTQPTPANKQTKKSGSNGSSRKRKTMPSAQNGNQEPTDVEITGSGPANSATAPVSQGPQTKRRRTSNMTSEPVVANNIESQASSTETSASPVLHSNGGAPRVRLPSAKSNPVPNGQQPEAQAQQAPQQQEQNLDHTQLLQIQQQRQQNPYLPRQPSSQNPANEQQRALMNNMPPAKRAKRPKSYAQPQQQQQQQQNINPQAFYAQQQQQPQQPQYGQMRRNMTAQNTPGFQPSQQYQAPADFNNQTFTNIDYGNAHNRHVAAANAAFGEQGQLDPNSQNTIYQAMARRG